MIYYKFYYSKKKSIYEQGFNLVNIFPFHDNILKEIKKNIRFKLIEQKSKKIKYGRGKKEMEKFLNEKKYKTKIVYNLDYFIIFK